MGTPKPRNFSLVVDGDCMGQLQIGAGRNDCIQIDHAAVLPEESVLADEDGAKLLVFRSADNLPARVHKVRIAARVSGKHSKIDGLAMGAEHAIVDLRRRSGVICLAYDIAAIIDPVGGSVFSTEMPRSLR